MLTFLKLDNEHASYTNVISHKESTVVELEIVSGHVSSVIDDLKKKVSSYQRGKIKFKIGISVDPEVRWTKHRRSQHEWSKMVVLYESTSHDSISRAESDLIDYSLSKFPDKCQNKIGGGGGINEPYLYERFYLYLLVK